MEEEKYNIENVHFSEKECLKKFIRVWETCPELWNTSSNAYRDKLKKNIALDKLLAIYKNIKPASTREDVKKKLNSLRTNFRKELKKVFQSKSSGKETDDIYVPSSWTYCELLFLIKDDQPAEKSQEDTESNFNTNTQDHQYSTSLMDPLASPITTGPKKEVGIDQQALMERTVSFIAKSDNDFDFEDQEEYHLAKVWASKLRKLTTNQKIFAEKAIHDVLFEATLGNLNESSVKINESSNNDSYPPPCRNTNKTIYMYTEKKNKPIKLFKKALQ